MGGLGSGRPARTRPLATTEQYPRLDIRWLKRHHALDRILRSEEPHRLPIAVAATGAVCITVQVLGDGYHLQVEVVRLDELGFPGHPAIDVISLDETPCPYGGWRRWFSCPGCLKRCAVLYWCRGRFKCATCHALTHASTRETAAQRATRRAAKLQARLGPGRDVLDLFDPGTRPRGMHRSTYRRLVADLERCEDIVADDIARRLRRHEQWLTQLKIS